MSSWCSAADEFAFSRHTEVSNGWSTLVECELKVFAKLVANELKGCLAKLVKNELMDCLTKLLGKLMLGN